MAYVGQPTMCGHEDRHPIPGTVLDAVRTCHVQPAGAWSPDHEHRYGVFVLRIIEDDGGGR